MPTDDRSSPSGDGFKSQALHQQQVSPSQIGESKGTGSRALVDTDFYAYKAAAASTFTAKWDEHNRIGMTNLSMAKDKFRGFIEWVEESVPGHTPIFCLGGRSNFRYGLYPSYKSNRRERLRPWGYDEFMDWIRDTFLTIQINNVETDDVLGLSYESGDVIISGDKDMRTIPGVHLQGEEVIEVSQDEADHNFYCQVLSGDSTDGYPGCKGTGVVGAAKLLAHCTNNEERWGLVRQAYRKAKHDEYFAITQARLARILRVGEYDYENGEPKLWIPPVA